MKEIFIKPLKAEFYAQNILFIFFLFITVLLFGYDNFYTKIICIAISSLLILALLIRWWKITVTSWTITGEQIIYKRGILNVEVDFLELYRVVDFKETQNMIQQIAGTKTIIITSGDKSHPTLILFGIKNDNKIIDIMRSRVELNKQQKNIYEIANR